MTQSITQLIERLEKAEAGSRELDGAMVDAVPHGGPFEVTRSLDAAIALVQRKGAKWGRSPLTGRMIVDARGAGGNQDFSDNPDPALALCTALLKALQAKEVGQ